MTDPYEENPKPVTVEEASAKVKAAEEAKTAADEAEKEARKSVQTPEQQKAHDARLAANKAAAEAEAARAALQQARANEKLEYKLGRKLRAGEYARWANGDRDNLRLANIELCSPAILELEKKLGRHVDEEDLFALDREFDGKK